jgi:hypothetical protein
MQRQSSQTDDLKTPGRFIDPAGSEGQRSSPVRGLDQPE